MTKLYRLNPKFAGKKGIPAVVTAKKLVEVEKAVYLYGRGEQDPLGQCSKCGRPLTHPGSILIGIGPVCLQDWGARDAKLDNLSDEDVERLKAFVREQTVDCWVPKSCIKDEMDTDVEISVPEDHDMVRPRTKMKDGKPTPKPKSTVSREAKVVRSTKTGKTGIKITFPFDRDDVDRVKSLSGRKYHPEGKFWTCDLTVDNVEGLEFWGFKLSDSLNQFLQDARTDINEIEVVKGINSKLYDFQKKGVSFIEKRNGRALIADEMGLGKTAQALSWVDLHPEKRPVLVVVPASLKLNWERETDMWLSDSKVRVLEGTKPYPLDVSADVFIINYDIVSSWTNTLREKDFKVMILDEIHYIKNNKAKRTKAVKKIAKDIPHVIGLSGTPIINRPVEGYNALKLIDDTVVGKFWDYANKYCNAHHNGWGWDFSGATNTDELHKHLTSTVMIRRKKEDVLKDLPEKTYSWVPVEINNREEYRMVSEDFIEWVEENKGSEKAQKASNGEAFAKIEALKQLTIKGKLDKCMDWIQDYLDADGKLVVFATHKDTIKALMKKFKDIAVKVDGSVSGDARQKAVDKFQNDDSVRLFVGNIKAAGVGLTLTAASSVAFLELPWTPGEVDQAADRVHRIGQKNAVNVYYLLANNTIEETMAGIIDRKREVLDSVLDGKKTESDSLLSELLETV